MKDKLLEDILFDKLSAPVEAAEPEIAAEPEAAAAQPMPVEAQEPPQGSGIDWSYAELCQTEIGERIAAMDSLRESHGQQPDGHGLRRLIKRLWRKLCAWYVEPTFARQSVFNSSATPAIGRMAELHSLYGEGLQRMERQIDLLRQDTRFLRSEQFDLDSRLQRSDGRLGKLEQGQNSLFGSISGLQLRCDALEERSAQFTERCDALEERSAWLAERCDALEERSAWLAERCDALENRNTWFAERCDALEKRSAQLEERSAQLEELQRTTAAAAAEAARQLQRLRELDVGLGSPFADERGVEFDCAQNGEDRILRHVFQVLGYREEQCSYLDLGANHAKILSNTWYFYKRGGRGVLVEANPALIAELKLFRSGDVILNRCVAESGGETMDFYILSGDGLSTPDLAGAEAAIAENPALSIERTVQVESISVNELMDTYFDGAPLLLSLDIEGKEMEILRSIDFEKHRPLAVVIEVIPYRNTLYVGERNREIIDFMAERGYQEYAFTGINSIFLDSRQLGRASV